MRGLDIWDFVLLLSIAVTAHGIHHTEKHLEAIEADIRIELSHQPSVRRP